MSDADGRRAHAKVLLLSANEPPLPSIQHVALAADPDFQDEFVDCMTFPTVEKE